MSAATGPASGDRLFRIGSVTEVVTALALADAVARGELTVDTRWRHCCRNPGRWDRRPHDAGPPGDPHLEAAATAPGLLRRALRSRADPYRDVTTDHPLGALAGPRLRSEREPGSSGHTALWHSGGTGGFAGSVALSSAAEVGVVVLANTARSVDRLGVRLLDTLAGATRSHP